MTLPTIKNKISSDDYLRATIVNIKGTVFKQPKSLSQGLNLLGAYNF